MTEHLMHPAHTAAEVIAHARTQFGFLAGADLATLASDPTHRLTLVLVRCGRCRFVAPAQDVQFLIDAIEKAGADYVRDASLWTPPATGTSWRSGA